MNETPFPKPPPAEHLPLEAWLRRTDRAEAGREPFFRGRDEEYDVFRGAVNSLNDGMVGGGTMVFQGAPGAGKSALMAECMEAVRRHSKPEDPWLAVSIYPDTLRFPVDVVRTLVDAANEESARLRKMLSRSNIFSLGKMLTRRPATKALDNLLNIGRKVYQNLSERGVGVAVVSVGGRKEEESVAASRVFKDAAHLLKRFRIVVFVDEAQNLRDEGMSRDVLDCLHRDPGGIPLVAAFFGLSNTAKILGECGLSRLPDGRMVNLEPLAREDAASAIRGAFDAYGFAGAAEDREQWVDSLAQLSQGWPQHVNRVSMAAARTIKEQGGRITMEYLEDALERGRKRKNAYYEGRLAAGSRDAWVYRQLAMAMEEKGGALPRHEIGALTELARAEESQSLNEFVTDALRTGLLAPTTELPDHYKIPIPSLGDYLQALPVEPPPQFRTEHETTETKT